MPLPQVIREAYKLEKRVLTKSSAADLVTETDQRVEKMIISKLKDRFPAHSFIGEESVAAGQHCELTDNPTWIIDPIDGTTNIVHRFPFVAVCIGLVVNKKAQIGIVYNAIQDEMFTARLGQGSVCNGERIQVSGQEGRQGSHSLTTDERNFSQVSNQSRKSADYCGINIQNHQSPMAAEYDLLRDSEN
ncbi:inositol monophosphatase 1-like [Ptychodera flava]|uniref:inositol monophosphatase 1-like n=1 Tax=Ptychodera flava TaxID=63121 RepID=UPI00396A8945